MSIEEVISAIPDFTADRYSISSDSDFGQLISSFRPQSIERSQVIRLKRQQAHTAAWRTILVIEINNMEGLVNGLRWAAGVRDELLNGESADLYLFIITEHTEAFPIETCINIEAGEQYCRKYITRPGETIADFMNRTFLCKFERADQLQNVTDPLKLALLKTSERFSTFNDAEQEKWRQTFLSGVSGLELADIIFSEELKAE